MKYTIYVKKEIKSEADLPKDKNEPYICYWQSSPDYGKLRWMKVDNNEGLWELVTWYLQPVELDLPDDEEIEKQARITHNDNTYRWIYTLAIHWLKNKIENQLKQ